MVEEVERLFAGSRHPRDGVAVTQCEAKLHVDLLGSLSRDPVGTKPVVLVRLHHITDLEGVDGPVVLIHFCDGIPLNSKTVGGGRKEKKREKHKTKRPTCIPIRQQCST